ncbi:hypothetical protein J6590_010788 [Homalodisca vitripennis]|nr:hypothetical protein J6590_010788 [Homalodisca vitripennis]
MRTTEQENKGDNCYPYGCLPSVGSNTEKNHPPLQQVHADLFGVSWRSSHWTPATGNEQYFMPVTRKGSAVCTIRLSCRRDAFQQRSLNIHVQIMFTKRHGIGVQLT